MYLRRQDLWVESRHKHSIISGQELSIEKLSTPHFCDYKKFIDLWAEEYGKENIVVRPYEKSQFVGGSIFSDFLSLFNMKLDDQWKLPERQVNVGLGNVENEFKKFCNRIGFNKGMVDRLNCLLIEHTVKNDKAIGSKLMSYSQCKQLLDRYISVNNSIVEEYLPNSGGELFTDALPVDKEEWKTFSGMGELEFREIIDYLKLRDLAIHAKVIKLSAYNLSNLEGNFREFARIATSMAK